VEGLDEIIVEEPLGNGSGNYDGAAFDKNSGIIFFASHSGGELWANRLRDDDPSFLSGQLEGMPASGTFYDGSYYYVDEALNTINKVTFDSDWMIAAETKLDTIPGQMLVNDIAMGPGGEALYLSGNSGTDGCKLVVWSPVSMQFSTLSMDIADGSQIAFGSDGELYAIAPVCPGSGILSVSMVDIEAAIVSPLEELPIEVPDPFGITDLSDGPAR
jgi:hypothetical protein